MICLHPRRRVCTIDNTPTVGLIVELIVELIVVDFIVVDFIVVDFIVVELIVVDFIEDPIVDTIPIADTIT
ncbi:hypothetical protein TrRE_jg8330 [Triparma retinervis]|uniref:Uncharacterized protein n=1 Tax=Triparma retinervis TaxID=2557542 RepID=A0A9W7AR06_9STRA|nr:hypothetical protein TrRE_jg8330 [Triparma retinervis]